MRRRMPRGHAGGNLRVYIESLTDDSNRQEKIIVRPWCFDDVTLYSFIARVPVPERKNELISPALIGFWSR